MVGVLRGYDPGGAPEREEVSAMWNPRPASPLGGFARSVGSVDEGHNSRAPRDCQPDARFFQSVFSVRSAAIGINAVGNYPGEDGRGALRWNVTAYSSAVFRGPGAPVITR